MKAKSIRRSVKAITQNQIKKYLIRTFMFLMCLVSLHQLIVFYQTPSEKILAEFRKALNEIDQKNPIGKNFGEFSKFCFASFAISLENHISVCETQHKLASKIYIYIYINKI